MMNYPRLLAALSLAIIMLAAALVPTTLPLPTTVDAGHDNPADSHLIRRSEDGGHGRILRNIILGDAIPVCSDDFPRSVKSAAVAWHAALGSTSVFELEQDGTVFESADPGCATAQSDLGLGVGSLLVLHDAGNVCGFRGSDSDELDEDEDTWGGCTRAALKPPNEDWDTYVGQAKVYANVPLSEDGELGMLRLIAHELGKV